MKLFSKSLFLLILLFLAAFSKNSFGMEQNEQIGKIIILAGTSCSGKTTIATELCKTQNFEYVSQDAISDEDIDQFEEKKIKTKLDGEQFLALDKAKEFAANGKIVVCDIVPLNSLDQIILADIIEQTQSYPTYKVFIHTPYEQLMQQVEERNNLAQKTNSPEEKRHPYHVAKQFAETYKKADPRKTSPTKQIPVKIKSPDIERQFIQASPPNSPLLETRLIGTVRRNLFPNKEQEILCITTIEKYDYIFQNNKYNPKTLKPSALPSLIFAINEWLETAEEEWEEATDKIFDIQETNINIDEFTSDSEEELK